MRALVRVWEGAAQPWWELVRMIFLAGSCGEEEIGKKQRAREDKRKKKPAGRGLGDDSWFHAAVGRVGPVASFQVGPFVVCVLLDCCS